MEVLSFRRNHQADPEVLARTRPPRGSERMTLRRPPRKRPLHPIPDFVRQALTSRRLWSRYRARPFYQRNDYVGWIVRGVREATRQRRLEQMLEELAAGDRYMKMKYRPQ